MSPDIPTIVIREPGRTALHVLVIEPIYVGRGGSGILLDDPQVSRQHLELIPERDGLWIRDCGSTHGTSLDDIPVNEKMLLMERSVVRLGNVTIELCNIKNSAGDQLNLSGIVPSYEAGQNYLWSFLVSDGFSSQSVQLKVDIAAAASTNVTSGNVIIPKTEVSTLTLSVTDDQNNPLSNAEVKIIGQSSLLTDSLGQVSLKIIKNFRSLV